MDKNKSKYYNTALLMDEALLSILEKKEFPYITVKEICIKAGVNRSTFYLHYETIDDLLQETIDLIENRFNSSFHKKTSIKKSILEKKPENLILITREYLKHYVEFIFNNQKIFMLSLSKSMLFKNSDRFLKMNYEYFEPVMDYFKVDKKTQPYMIEFFCHGIISIIKKWLENNCNESIEEIIQIILQCVEIDSIMEKYGK